MGRTIHDLEAYLTASSRTFETSDDGTLIVAPRGAGLPPIYVRLSEADDESHPVLFSVSVGNAPKGQEEQTKLFRRLLELNGSDLLYGAYALRGEEIVLSSAAELHNLDLNEVQAILSDLDLALASHLEELFSLAGRPSTAPGAT
jgi:hypothetical protein